MFDPALKRPASECGWKLRSQPKPLIVAAGEALIDLMPTRDALGEPALRPLAGGSPFNVAVALGRLGARAAFLGALSTDGFGDTLMAALAASGVETALVTRVERPTPLALVDAAGAEARYTFYDAGTAARGMTLRELKPLPAEPGMLHFGSLALAAEPAASTLIARAKIAAAGGWLISIDPNIRPEFPVNATHYRRNIEQAMELAHVVKLSAADLAWLRPGLAIEKFAAERIAAGVRLVVVTSGESGARGFIRDAEVPMPSHPVTVVDTVGAGDAFMAALLAHLAESKTASTRALARLDAAGLGDALAFAAHVAALACTRAGADPPWRREVASDFEL